jgi:hypothetical protein
LIISIDKGSDLVKDLSQVSGLSPKSTGVFCVGPVSPDVDTASAQIRFISIAGEKPEKFFRDPAKGNSFGGYNREALA